MEKNYKNESMVDIAYDILKENNRNMNFQEIYLEVSKKLELTPEEKINKMSQFYTNLSLDGRFVNCKNSEWNLRENVSYENAHQSLNDYYADIDEETIANTDTEELDDEEKEAMDLNKVDDDDKDYDSPKEEDL